MINVVSHDLALLTSRYSNHSSTLIVLIYTTNLAEVVVRKICHGPCQWSLSIITRQRYFEPIWMCLYYNALRIQTLYKVFFFLELTHLRFGPSSCCGDEFETPGGIRKPAPRAHISNAIVISLLSLL